MSISRMSIEYLLVDGTTGVAHPNMGDRIAWDRTSSSKGWPKPQDATSLWTAFLVWHYLARTGEVKDSFEHWTENVLEQAVMEDRATEDGEAETVDPTRPTVHTG